MAGSLCHRWGQKRLRHKPSPCTAQGTENYYMHFSLIVSSNIFTFIKFVDCPDTKVLICQINNY